MNIILYNLTDIKIKIMKEIVRKNYEGNSEKDWKRSKFAQTEIWHNKYT